MEAVVQRLREEVERLNQSNYIPLLDWMTETQLKNVTPELKLKFRVLHVNIRNFLFSESFSEYLARFLNPGDLSAIFLHKSAMPNVGIHYEFVIAELDNEKIKILKEPIRTTGVYLFKLCDNEIHSVVVVIDTQKVTIFNTWVGKREAKIVEMTPEKWWAYLSLFGKKPGRKTLSLVSKCFGFTEVNTRESTNLKRPLFPVIRYEKIL